MGAFQAVEDLGGIQELVDALKGPQEPLEFKDGGQAALAHPATSSALMALAAWSSWSRSTRLGLPRLTRVQVCWPVIWKAKRVLLRATARPAAPSSVAAIAGQGGGRCGMLVMLQSSREGLSCRGGEWAFPGLALPAFVRCLSRVLSTTSLVIASPLVCHHPRAHPFLAGLWRLPCGVLVMCQDNSTL